MFGGPVHGVTIQIGPGDLPAMSFPLWEGARQRNPSGPAQIYFPGAVSAERGATLALFDHMNPRLTRGIVELRGENGEAVTIGLAGGESRDSIEFGLASAQDA
ncbi:MAG: hypothetical protein IH919_04805, partial [Deltaproteobacteria bacterium]|nr:hypothetical protein [Deltaproteobacteria bacterium]